MSGNEDDLILLRKQISEADTELIRIFTERMRLSEKVAAYKIKTGKPIFDPEREKAVINRVTECAGREFSRGAEKLYTVILELSRARQAMLISGALPKSERNIVVAGKKGSAISEIASKCALLLRRPLFNADLSDTSHIGAVLTAGCGSVSSPERREKLISGGYIVYIKDPVPAENDFENIFMDISSAELSYDNTDSCVSKIIRIWDSLPDPDTIKNITI